MRTCEKCNKKVGAFKPRHRDVRGRLLGECCFNGPTPHQAVTGSVTITEHTWAESPEAEILVAPGRYAIKVVDDDGMWIEHTAGTLLLPPENIHEGVLDPIPTPVNEPGHRCAVCNDSIYSLGGNTPMWVHTNTGNSKGVEGHAAAPAPEKKTAADMSNVQASYKVDGGKIYADGQVIGTITDEGQASEIGEALADLLRLLAEAYAHDQTGQQVAIIRALKTFPGVAWSAGGFTASITTVAHDSGDGQTIYHCPFCGSGNVIGRGDGSAECGYCHNTFTVQVQPMHPFMPQTNPATGEPMQMPGMPGAIDPALPGTPLPDPGAPVGPDGAPVGPPGAEPPPGAPGEPPPGAGAAPTGPEKDEKPKGGNQPPWLKHKSSLGHAQGDRVVVNGKPGTVHSVKDDGQVMVRFDHRSKHKPTAVHPDHVRKASSFTTATGHQLDEDAYVNHLALKHAEPEQFGRVLASVRAAHSKTATFYSEIPPEPEDWMEKRAWYREHVQPELERFEAQNDSPGDALDSLAELMGVSPQHLYDLDSEHNG